MRRCFVVALLLLAVVQVAVANPLIEEWAGVQQALGSGEAEELEAGLQRLLNEANNLGLRRVTPFASALAAGSVNRQDEIGNLMLLVSKRLDPFLPAPRFIAGRQAWRADRKIEALGEFVTGVVNIFRHEPVRRAVVISLVPWMVFTLVIVVAVVILVQVFRFFRLLGSDAYFLGLRFFSRVNAVVFACVALLFPIFVGLGPTWVIVYLFALTWIYMAAVQRVAAAVFLGIIVFLTPVFEFWQSALLVPISLETRVGRMLENRQVDFSSLREFTELESSLEGSAVFHLVSGELLRMHGDRDYARQQYEKAILAAPNASMPTVFLGVFALEEKDPLRALELLNGAVELGPDSALAHYNLAIALDLTRRFKEGDSSRRTARALAGRDIGELGRRGYDERALFPKLGKSMVRRVVENAPGTVRLSLQGSRGNFPLGLGFFSSVSLVGAFGLLVGCVVFFVRRKWFDAARECIKCGRVFRQEDNSVYCRQCVSVFLKRNAVSIEQQTSKVAQVKRWGATVNWARRIVGVLVPGGSEVAGGQSFSGMLLAFVIWLPLVAAFVWIPMFLREVIPTAPILGFQVVMAFVGVSVWVVTAVSAWNRR
ncbi:MAG: hypothetical protein K8R59_04205 [Thermoanaerobaculales bacterium]|nr:hypothetical protein [Thermoanaerobaculales bacterium]